MAGYELKAQIEGSLGNFWSESYGQLYPQLASLEAAGLIEIDPEAQSDGRGKKVYKITSAGRAHLSDWLKEAPKNRPLRNELLMKVFFAAEGDLSAIAAHVEVSKAAAVAGLKKYQGIKADLIDRARTNPKARFWLMTVRSGIQHAQTHLNWCAEVLSELELMEGNRNEES